MCDILQYPLQPTNPSHNICYFMGEQTQQNHSQMPQTNANHITCVNTATKAKISYEF